MRLAVRGFTLAEIVIAALIAAIVVVGIFSVVLSVKVAAGKSTRRTQANFYVRTAGERLRAYMSADRSVPGPGSPPNRWKLAEDASPLAWAFDPGDHDISALLPARCGPGVELCREAPVGATLVYTVTDAPDADPNCGKPAVGPDPCKIVSFRINWND